MIDFSRGERVGQHGGKAAGRRRRHLDVDCLGGRHKADRVLSGRRPGRLAARLAKRVQLTTDGLKAYLDAVEGAFGVEVDYAQLVELYGNVPESAKGRYSPTECTGIRKIRVEGRPDHARVSTSYVERQNLTMLMRRFTRLTNGFSKKGLPHYHMVALYTVWYNFVCVHKMLKVSPAMAAGVSKTLSNTEDVVTLIDARAEPPKPPGPYQTKARRLALVAPENST